MKKNSKFGLKNASNYLNQIKCKYQKRTPQDTPLFPQNKTFADQDSLELAENKIMSEQIKSHSKYKNNSHNKDVVVEEFSEIKMVQKQKPSFCDRIVLNKLQSTLKVYQQDLQILSQNRSFLQQQIQMLAQKIQKLSQMKENNIVLATQNQKQKKNLRQLMEIAHQADHQLFVHKIKHQEAFNSTRNKVRTVIKELGEDYRFYGFVEMWNRHIQQYLSDRKALSLRKNTQKKEENIEKIKIPQIKQQVEHDDTYLAPDQPKPKKKLTAAEKAALLGDLKSFSKNFKLPPNG